jgi:hypothetical protein
MVFVNGRRWQIYRIDPGLRIFDFKMCHVQKEVPEPGEQIVGINSAVLQAVLLRPPRCLHYHHSQPDAAVVFAL